MRDVWKERRRRELVARENQKEDRSKEIKRMADAAEEGIRQRERLRKIREGCERNE